MYALPTIPARYRLAVAGLSLLALTACGSSAPSSTAPASLGSTSSRGVTAGAVLPVKSNPITSSATAKTLSITKLLVENNLDASGKVAPDHIELHLNDTGSTTLGGLEVYYTETDTTTKATESYYTKLPPSVTIAAGGSKTIHFDNSGAPGHFPVNKFDIYHTSKSGIGITVEVSAAGAAPVKATVTKAAGGAETAD